MTLKKDWATTDYLPLFPLVMLVKTRCLTALVHITSSWHRRLILNWVRVKFYTMLLKPPRAGITPLTFVVQRLLHPVSCGLRFRFRS